MTARRNKGKKAKIEDIRAEADELANTACRALDTNHIYYKTYLAAIYLRTNHALKTAKLKKESSKTTAPQGQNERNAP